MCMRFGTDAGRDFLSTKDPQSGIANIDNDKKRSAIGNGTLAKSSTRQTDSSGTRGFFAGCRTRTPDRKAP